MPTALITGVTGQDGSYLTELLLGKGYEVHGIVRRSSNTVRPRLDHLTSDASVYGHSLFLHYSDLDDTTTIRRLLRTIAPDEVYHLAGQSHVALSFEVPESTCEFTAMGTLRLLEILRDCDPVPKLLHVSSSEIFGSPDHQPQNETTAMQPITPYGAAKAFASNMVRIYRENFGMFACNAVCYNHESPRRGQSFVTRKITSAAARISLGQQSHLMLGNIDGRRDWGFAPDYVVGFHQMLQIGQPTDLILATGETHSVRDWLELAFSLLGLEWQKYVRQDEKFLRSADSQTLVGDASLARSTLGWKAKTDFNEMVRLMVESDLKLARERCY